MREGQSGCQLMWRTRQDRPLGLLQREGQNFVKHGLVLEAALALEPAITLVTLLQQECVSFLCQAHCSLFKQYIFVCLLVLLFDRASYRSG